jgi:CRP-like cAMP-binding protein
VATIPEALVRHPAFAGLSVEAVQGLASRCEHLHLPTGGVLFHEGDPAAHLYLVLRGRLRATCRGEPGVEVVVGGAHGGDVVGEMGVLDGAPRSATLTAEGPVEVVRMRGGVLTSLVESGHPAAAPLLRVVRRQLVERIRETDERVDAVFEMLAPGGE